MAFLLRALVALLLSAACVHAAGVTRVLFVGNSYTFYNDLPGMLAAMGQKRGVPFECTVRVEGSASLHSHWQGGVGRELQGGRFDYVVLQDQSMVPVFQPDSTVRYGGEFCRAALAAGCRPVFLLTWARLAPQGALDADMQNRLTLAYSQAAVQGGALLSPAGEAWRRAYAAIPGCRLHGEDGSHPNAYGTYLTACVLFHTLTGQPSLGLPGTLQAQEGRRRRLFCRLSPERARALQQCADKVAASFSAEKYLQRFRERQSVLPDGGDVEARLRKGMAVREVDALAGSPVYIDRETRNRQYRLRDGGELSAVFDRKGGLVGASLTLPGGAVKVLNWVKPPAALPQQAHP